MNKQYLSERYKFGLNLIPLFKVAAEMFTPREDILPSEWAAKYRYVAPEVSSRPGLWKPENAPHTVELMDCVFREEVEQVSIMGSAQIGKTITLENLQGYIIANRPQPFIYMQTSEVMAKTYSTEKFEKMIEVTPVVREKMAAKKGKSKDYTDTLKKFRGGYASFVWGTSKAGLRMRSIPIVMSDDIDSFDVNLAEGDPVARVEKRAETFDGVRKLIRISSPGRELTSKIKKYFEAGSQAKYHVRCLECGEEQVLQFENLVWDKSTDLFGKPLEHFPESTKIACAHCGALHDEGARIQMLQNGRWIHKYPERVHHRSFWINAISSTLSTMRRIVEEYTLALNDEEKMESFINTVLGLPYQAKEIKSVSENELMDRLESYCTEENPGVPNGVLYLTLSVDVQADRLEVAVHGWGVSEEYWLLYYQKIYGDIDQFDVFDEITKLRHKSWIREDGIPLRVSVSFIDSGYQGNSKTIYEYCRMYATEGVFACKGKGGYGRKLFTLSPAYDKRIELFTIGTNEAKSVLFRRLGKGEPGAQYLHFTDEYCDIEFFQGLTSEHAVKKSNGDYDYYVYEVKKKGIRNEPLDLWVMGFVALSIYRLDWQNLEKKILSRRKVERVSTVVESPKIINEINKSETNRNRVPALVKGTSWMNVGLP